MEWVGSTIRVDNSILDFTTTNKTLVYLGGEAMLQVGKDSLFAVTLFNQEVQNLTSSPRKAEFGAYSLSLEFSSGEFCLIYPNKDTNSDIVVSTPMASYQLSGGKYYFKVGKSTLVFVLEGGMMVHGDKSKVDVVEKGSLAIAVPFADPSSGIDDKIITSFKKAKAEENERFAAPILQIERKWADVGFFVVDGKVVGIRLK